MKVELKNIYVNQRMSRETLLFEADIYINGVKAGYAENDGQGGSTNYRGTSEEGRKLIKAAEEYCKGLPAKVEELDIDGRKEKYTSAVSLESMIDDMVSDYLNEKSRKRSEDRFDKKMLKDMEYGILAGVPGKREYSHLPYKVPIAKILETPVYRAALKTAITNKLLPAMKAGEKILNTNIHPDDLRMLGVPEQYIVQPEKKIKRKPVGPRVKGDAAKKKGGKKP